MVAVIFSLGSVAFAAEPYQGYNYNSWSVSEPTPNAYEATESVSGVTAGAGDFASPQDMVYRNGELFILDSGNARVVVLDEQYRLKREYSRFSWQSEELTLNNPKGLYVSTKDRLYIADTDNARVLICDMVGNVLDVLKKPDSEVFPENIEFKPNG